MNIIYNKIRYIATFWKKVTNQFYGLENCLKFKLLDIQYGHRCIIHGHIYCNIGKNAVVTIGDNFCFLCGRAINPLSRNSGGVIAANENASIIIGNNVGISSSVLWAHEAITIGNHVNIGANTVVMDSDAHSLNFQDRRNIANDMKNKKNKPIVIGDDVLIGANCIILKGVVIGEHSVIGAGSVVTSSIPSNCIAAGNPAKIIKYL